MTNGRTTYIGGDVINQDQQTIGKVTDVLFDATDDHPKWLVVNPGLLHAERYVPIEGSYTSDAGEIVVPFDKKWIKAAPKAGDHVMSDGVETEAVRHYDVH